MPEISASAVQTAAAPPPVKTKNLEELSNRINRIHDAIARRAYELFESEGCVNGSDVRHWLEAEKEILCSVPITTEESEAEIVVRAEVPGFTAGELEVDAESRRLTISGKHESRNETKEGGNVSTEELSTEILRSIELASNVDTAKVSASLKDGVLTVLLPKAADKKSASSSQQAA
jgi:HSP20 family molecular chaperone IbpA